MAPGLQKVQQQNKQDKKRKAKERLDVAEYYWGIVSKIECGIESRSFGCFIFSPPVMILALLVFLETFNELINDGTTKLFGEAILRGL